MKAVKRGRPKGSDAGRRVPAGDVEQLVADRITAFLWDEAAVFDAIKLSFLKTRSWVSAPVTN